MRKSISVVLPIYNEVKSLRYVIENWHFFLKKENFDHEFLLCEDGSSDGTKELIVELCKQYPCINLSEEKRRGYGGGVLAGIFASSKTYILCIDSDGQCMPNSFNKIYSMTETNDIVIGERLPRNDPKIRIIYSKLFFGLFKLLFKTKIKDPSCPYVIAKKNIYLKLIPFLSYMKEGFWWGFIGAAIKLKLKIKDIPITHFKRYDGSTVVYKPSKMPSIIIRNIIGMISLRLK